MVDFMTLKKNYMKVGKKLNLVREFIQFNNTDDDNLDCTHFFGL